MRRALFWQFPIVAALLVAVEVSGCMSRVVVDTDTRDAEAAEYARELCGLNRTERAARLEAVREKFGAGWFVVGCFERGAP